MYNKLILESLEEPFEITYDGQLHIVPNGKFEVEQKLWYFISALAKKWGKKVLRISEPEAPRIDSIKEKIVEVAEPTESTEPTKSVETPKVTVEDKENEVEVKEIKEVKKNSKTKK